MSNDDAAKPPIRNIAQRKWMTGELGSSFPTLEEVQEKIGAEFGNGHYQKLQLFKDLVLKAEELCPLEMSYDVSRVQHPYFLEFTWTTMLGGIYVSPQSGWLAALIADQAAQDRKAKPYTPPVADKYELEGNDSAIDHVVFIPGSNAFGATVSIEKLTGLMRSEPGAMIKPHPLTNPATIREIGREFGYHRILKPTSSGMDLLRSCKVAYVAGSEIGLQGVLLGKDVVDISNVMREARVGLGPVFAMLKEHPESLPRFLGSDLGGFFLPDMPDLAGRMSRYFANAMKRREVFKPPIREIGHTEYADFLSGKYQRTGG